METLQKQVRRAQRRMTLQLFLQSLAWCWFITLSLSAAVILANWYWAWGVEPLICLGAALGLGIVLAGVWTVAFRRGSLDAALELDRRFGLKERVSSALALAEADLDSEAGKAVAEDAARRVGSLHVGERFGVKLNRWAALPLAPALAAFLLTAFLPEISPTASGPNANRATAAEQIKKPVQTLTRKLAERKQMAREKNLKKLEEMFNKLERATREEILRNNKPDKKDAVVKLNNLKQDLEQRRKELGSKDQLKEQFAQLKKFNDGPAGKLADALKDGDLKQAIEEIKKLQDQIKDGKLDKDAQQKLADQLDQMQKKLKQMVDDHKKKKQQLQQQIAQAKQNGNQQQAQKLQQQLDKMQQQSQQMQQMQQMQQKLGQCSQCLKQGQQAQAMQGLKDLQGDLQAMQDQMDELQLLDQAMDEIDQAKQSMLCQNCNGAGCPLCQGQKPGNGLGQGRGVGDRPESQTDKNKFVDTNVKQKTGPGSAVVIGEVDGPNIKGRVREEIKAELEAGEYEASDPLTGQRLPRGYREFAKEYFEALRKGE